MEEITITTTSIIQSKLNSLSSNKPPILLPTNGNCYFCYKSTKDFGGNPVNRPRQFPLNRLLHYLELNYDQIMKKVRGGGGSGLFSSIAPPTGGSKRVIKAELCGECCSTFKTFCNLHKQLDTLVNELDSQLNKIVFRLNASKFNQQVQQMVQEDGGAQLGNENGMEGEDNQFNVKLLTTLREETVKKCNFKLFREREKFTDVDLHEDNDEESGSGNLFTVPAPPPPPSLSDKAVGKEKAKEMEPMKVKSGRKNEADFKSVGVKRTHCGDISLQQRTEIKHTVTSHAGAEQLPLNLKDNHVKKMKSVAATAAGSVSSPQFGLEEKDKQEVTSSFSSKFTKGDHRRRDLRIIQDASSSSTWHQPPPPIMMRGGGCHGQMIVQDKMEADSGSDAEDSSYSMAGN